ncbi:superoxide dismutase mitochondrial precursor [Tothia fuscella]|uniref:Superoxide dismutase n=1 Tax=Tothia fuscella TaxID=1048955 RepID=A0A9P4TZR4_9PEZI|nr:superoxide dismutase mitochondrial precursor [Tothia fuscella]
MATTLFRQNAARSALRTLKPITGARAGLGGVTCTRGKATLPDLPYDYSALEPSISGKIMEVHHKNHHNTYVTSFNNFTEKLSTLSSSSDQSPQSIADQAALIPLIKFHGGGHINHSLFWENLAPKNQGGGELPSGALGKAIDEHYGGLDKLKEKFNAALAGIQGSGWAWLVQDMGTGKLSIVTLQNQDPVLPPLRPILGVDAWEHAYYLQYQNRKAEYFGAIWDVINWKAAEKRFK